MFCPQCGQQISDELRFCSRCGFALDGVAKLIAADGTLPELNENVSSRSPRRRGIEQGAILMLVGMALLPLINVGVSPPYNEALLFLFLLGGILRSAYALVFQEGALLRKPKQNNTRSRLNTNADALASQSARQNITLKLNERQMEAAETVKLPEIATKETTKSLDEQNNPKSY